MKNKRLEDLDLFASMRSFIINLEYPFWFAVEDSNTPARLLDTLVNMGVVEALKNPNISPPVQDKALKDMRRFIRIDSPSNAQRKHMHYLMQNPALPESAFQPALKSSASLVLDWEHGAMLNPNAPREALQRLLGLGKPLYLMPIYSRWSIARFYGSYNGSTYEIPAREFPVEDMVYHDRPEMVNYLSSHPDFPEPLREYVLARNRHVPLRSLALNPTLSEDHFMRLADSGKDSVLLILAVNPATPASLLASMIRSRKVSLATRMLALRNPNAPLDLVRFTWDMIALRTRDYPDKRLKLSILRNPNLTDEEVSEGIQTVTRIHGDLDIESLFSILAGRPTLSDELWEQIENVLVSPENKKRIKDRGIDIAKVNRELIT